MNGPYLDVLQWLMLPLSMLSAAVDGYLSELDHMLDAGAIYLGPGK